MKQYGESNSTMEPGTIQKTGERRERRMSKGKFLRKALVLWLAFAFLSLPMYAEKVSVEKAKKVAEAQLAGMSQLRSQKQLKLQYTRKLTAAQNGLRAAQGEIPVYYVFGINKNDGFIIVSGDDVAIPVLGYSTSGTYDESNPNFKYWMDCLAQEIEWAVENKIPQSAETNAKWKALATGIYSKAPTSVPIVGPLLTTTWAQEAYYNARCPEDPNVPWYCDGHVRTGCVATEMAQLMKYWNYPTKGTGSHSYNGGIYGTLSADFGNTTYNWANMPNELTSQSSLTEIEAVATLMYHCGVSTDMEYGASGSTATSLAPYNALHDYFDYKTRYFPRNRALYLDNETEWINLLKTELDAGRPFIYGGRGTSGGHGWICDGYDDSNPTLFHFNWGWMGNDDGYYSVNDLSPGGDDYNIITSHLVTTADPNATLASLSINQGALTPAFNAEITDYTVDVDNSINSIAISAMPSHSIATVSGTGTQTLSVGENTFNIIVSVEGRRTPKTYTVVVNRANQITAPPTVTTQAATNITQTSATLNKTVTAGTETITEQGFKYKKASESDWLTSANGSLTGLTADTQYQFYAYATTASGTVNGETRTFTTTSTPTVVPTGISLNKTDMTLAVGSSEFLVATVSPANATSKNVTWTSSNANVAAVDTSGKVTAKAQGSTTVTVTTVEGNKTATCAVTVNSAIVPVTGVSLNKTDMTLAVGSSEFLVATVSPANATSKKVTWTSSNANVAAVDTSGKVTAKAQGSTTVTVTTVEGNKTATCAVTVSGNPSSPCSTPTAQGTTGSLTWKLCPDSTLTISGNGAMPDYTLHDNVAPSWDNYRGDITNIIIQDGVTSIGNDAFKWCGGLKTVTIGNSVTSIGLDAFHSCSNLTSVTIPNSVKTIGDGSFAGCGLTSVIIPNSVTSIGDYGFAECSSLASVTIGNSVTSIGSYAFSSCSALRSVTNLAETPQNIVADVFENVSVSAIPLTVPAGSLAKYKVAPVWKDFHFSTSGQTDYSPYRESKHFIFDIPTSYLTGIITPENLGRWMQHMDDAYEAYTVLVGHTPCDGQKLTFVASEDGYGALWVYGGKPYIYWNVDVIAEHLREINDYDSWGFGPMHEVGHHFDKEPEPNWFFQPEITANLKAIYAIDVLPDCKYDLGGQSNSLQDVYDYFYNYSVQDADDDDRYTDKITLAFINVARRYGWGVFTKTFNSYWDNSYPSTGCYDKYNDFVDRLEYFSGSKDIRSECFNVNNWLATIEKHYPHVYRQASGTFGTNLTWTLDCGTLTISGTGAMPDHTLPWDDYKSGITTVIIQDGVTSIGNDAFKWCGNLKTVTIGNSVASIGLDAFHSCSNLTSVTIPNSVKTIGYGSFGGSGLTSAIIPNSVTSIGEYGFAECSSLASVTIGNSVTFIGSYAFSNCSALRSVTNLATTPQSIVENVFENVTVSAIPLTVPSGSVAKYKAAAVWKDFSIKGQTAIETIDTNEFTVYPNPVRDELFIKSDKQVKKIEIFNTAGYLVVSTHSTTINISHLPKGIYIVKILVGNQSITQKIIKE